jgi:CheY-like chemotaxis protein
MSTDKSLNILLADDDIDDRELFAEAIKEVDPEIRVEMVEDGDALMHLLTETKKIPDLIFLDLNMPKKNGRECLSEIKSDSALKKIPIVIYSTSIRKNDAGQSWAKDTYCMVRKPDSYAVLIEIIKKIINHDFAKTDLNTDKFLFNRS